MQSLSTRHRAFRAVYRPRLTDAENSILLDHCFMTTRRTGSFFVVLLVIQLLGLVDRLAGQVHAQLLEHAVIDLCQNDRGMHLAALELG